MLSQSHAGTHQWRQGPHLSALNIFRGSIRAMTASLYCNSRWKLLVIPHVQRNCLGKHTRCRQYRCTQRKVHLVRISRIKHMIVIITWADPLVHVGPHHLKAASRVAYVSVGRFHHYFVLVLYPARKPPERPTWFKFFCNSCQTTDKCWTNALT